MAVHFDDLTPAKAKRQTGKRNHPETALIIPGPCGQVCELAVNSSGASVALVESLPVRQVELLAMLVRDDKRVF